MCMHTCRIAVYSWPVNEFLSLSPLYLFSLSHSHFSHHSVYFFPSTPHHPVPFSVCLPLPFLPPPHPPPFYSVYLPSPSLSLPLPPPLLIPPSLPSAFSLVLSFRSTVSWVSRTATQTFTLTLVAPQSGTTSFAGRRSFTSSHRPRRI